MSTSGTTATSAPAANGGGSSTSAFTACLKQHGVTLPAGLGGGRGGPGAAGPGGGLPPGRVGRSSGRVPGRWWRRRWWRGLVVGAAVGVQCVPLEVACGWLRWWAWTRGWGDCVPAQGVHVVFERQRREGPDHDLDAGGGGSGRRFGNPLAGLRSDPRFAAASKKCAALLPSRGQGRRRPRRVDRPINRAAGSRPNRAVREWVRCHA